jgi:anti-sigma-K factor RskA
MSEQEKTSSTPDQLIDLVLGDLDPGEARKVERELGEDPLLAAEARRLKATFDLLGRASLADPPPELKSRLLRAAGPSRAKAPGRSRLVAILSPLAAIAASLVAIILGYDSYRVRNELALERELHSALQQPNVVRSFSLVGTGEGSGAFGNVSLDLDAKKGALVMKDLPPLPAGRVYRLWAVVADRTVPCGDFRVRPDGSALAQFVVPVESYDAPLGRLLVTVEPPTPTEGPTGPTVMESV